MPSLPLGHDIEMIEHERDMHKRAGHKGRDREGKKAYTNVARSRGMGETKLT